MGRKRIIRTTVRHRSWEPELLPLDPLDVDVVRGSEAHVGRAKGIQSPERRRTTTEAGAEPLRGGILQQSSALDLGRARLRTARIGALPPLLLGQLSSIRCSISHERFVPA
jgi:hypothetical protein